ncbi:hypothetical protein GBA52_005049 [Prunus armeniaca]|nr:hypothetical protein GBA52_005049 [Prunus armeniaca]
MKRGTRWHTSSSTQAASKVQKCPNWHCPTLYTSIISESQVGACILLGPGD